MQQMDGIKQVGQNQYNNRVGHDQPLSVGGREDVACEQEGIDVPLFSYAKSKTDHIKTGSVMDNFDEFRKQKLAQEKEKAIEKEALLEEQKEQTKDLAAALSEDELAMLRSMGIDVESAKLSDLQGIVGTMQQQKHKEELGRIIQGMQMEAMPQEDKHFSLSNDELVYLLRNELPTTKDNLLKAHYSRSRMQEQQLPADAFEPMRQQIASIIEQTGYEVKEEAFEGARRLLANGIPVTTDTMTQYLDYQALVGVPIDEASLPERTQALLEKRAQRLTEDISSITDETVQLMCAQEKTITIRSALLFAKGTMGVMAPGQTKYNEIHSYETIRQMRIFQEIRLTMTAEAANRLVAKDINIDTKPLVKVLDALREIEQQMLSYTMREEGIQDTGQAAQLYYEAKAMVSQVANAPATVLAAPLWQGRFTISTLYGETMRQSGTEDRSVTASFGFEAVRRSYEAVQTAPRFDMGDRISKAFSNIDAMLEEMHLEANEQNVRAVRILGHNAIEITEHNIEQIVTYDREVNELITNFSPAAVLALIKEGKNPIDEPIDALNRRLRARNDKGIVSDTDNFATFLRDMEKQRIVDANERESYIGLYRVMNQLAKSENREAGYIFANGANLTIRNLIAAMRSTRARGMDVSIDDMFGMLESRNVQGGRMDEQLEKAFLEQETAIVHERADAVTEEAMQYMRQNGIEQSLVNASAVNIMQNMPGGIYSMAESIFSRLSSYKKARDYAVEEETENITDSLTGEEVPVLFTPDCVLEQLRRGPLMADYYDTLNESLRDALFDAAAKGTIATNDISMLKTVQAGFRIMSGMARSDKYQIPIQTEAGIQLVKLSIEHGDARGTIKITMHTEAYGSIDGRFARHEGAVCGRLVAGESDANATLLAKEDSFIAALQKEGATVYDVRLGQSLETMPEYEPQSAGTELYDTMLACVKAMQSLF